MKEELKKYIISQLGRTNKKNFENYCITRIYHLVDREDLKFVTQQMFRRGDGKIALVDLYFPQIDLIVEIDEGHHGSQEKEDEERTKKIIKHKLSYFEEVINEDLYVERIEVAKSSLRQINNQIGVVVAKIKERIKTREDNKSFQKWERLYQPPQYYINNKGDLDANEKPAFHTIKEVSDLFKKGYGGYQKGGFWDSNEKQNLVWCPQLELNGQESKSKWVNKISDNGNLIYESSKNESENKAELELGEYMKNKKTRYVFAYFKDSSGMGMYRFRGVFELDVNLTKGQITKDRRAVWAKTRDKIDLKKYHKNND